ncbi:MAG: DUF4382 domain-containing protein [Terriglobales bacterium]
MRKISSVSLATALAFATMLTLSACGGNSSTSVGTSPGQGSFNGPAPDSQAVITAGDAPMSGVLAAQITIGSITAANANGSTTTLLANPAAVELSHLGTGQTLVDVDPLPQGTYNSLMFTITSANFTYMNGGTVAYATSNPPTGTAATVTIPTASQSLTYTFAKPVVVNYQNASLLNLDFNLAQELDLTSGMVTFSPTVTGTTANVAVTLAAATGLSGSQATVQAYGTIASVNTSSTASAGLVLTTDASSYGETVYTSTSTLYNAALSLSNLAVGARARVVGSINADGSLAAISVESADNGAAEIPVVVAKVSTVPGSVNNGVVVGTTGTGFTLVVTNSSVPTQVGQEITVNTGSATVYAAAADAAGAGQTATFDATQVFVGQAVWVAGANDAASTSTAVVIDATNVNQSAVSLQALTTGEPTVTAGSDGTTTIAYVFPLSSSFSNLASGTAVTATALTCAAVGTASAPAGCMAANLDGPYLQFGASPAPATEPTGDTVFARGYLTVSGGAYSLALTDINDPTAIPVPPTT